MAGPQERAIAAHLQPDDQVAKNDIERVYISVLVSAVATGGYRARSHDLSANPGDSGIAVRAALAMARVSELNRWLGTMGVPVALAEDLTSGWRDPARSGESPEARRDRLTRRRDELKATDVRDFNARLAGEEGVSVNRIQQDLKQRERAGNLDSWLPHAHSRKRSKTKR